MSKSILLEGMIKGMVDMGAKFIKADKTHLYFDILTGSEIDNEEKLKRAKDGFTESFNLGLKVKRVTELT